MAPLSFFSFLLVALLVSAQSGLQGALRSLGLTVYFPGDAQYANVSQAYNLRFTVKPAAVIYPRTDQDISAILKVSLVNKYRVVARSGGHSYIANGLGGTDSHIVVDLSQMTKISVSAATGVATIQTGNRLGDVALALNNAGRALPHGTCPYVGIGGHSGHGGFGFTSRMWGLTLDTIVRATVVLANGTIVTVSEREHDDLFWAIRGSSSSFGIVSSIQFKTFLAPSYSKVFRYIWQLTYIEAADALGSFQEFVQTDIPPELGMEINVRKGNKNGTVYFDFVGGWYGAENAMNSTLKPLLDKLPPPNSIVLSGNGTYIDTVVFLEGKGTLDTHLKPDVTDTFYAKSLMTPESEPLTDAARKSFMHYLAVEGYGSTLVWFMQVELYGGRNSAINRVPVDSTAFARRNSMFTFQLYASSFNKLPPYPDSGLTFVNGVANSVISKMPKNWDYGAYLNYIDDRLENWQTLYYGKHYPHLESIKKQVDPHNVFRFPKSVEEYY